MVVRLREGHRVETFVRKFCSISVKTLADGSLGREHGGVVCVESTARASAFGNSSEMKRTRRR